MMTMFQGCFTVGLLLIVVSFLLGQIVNIFGIDGLDLSMLDFNIPIPISPQLLVLFVTLFGGNGMLFLRYAGGIHIAAIILLSLAIGLAVCILIKRYVLVPLKKAENTSAATKEELIGVLAKVSERIPAGGFGEITYVIYGNSYVAPAKSVSKEAIPKGTEVSICWIEDHVFFVVQIEERK